MKKLIFQDTKGVNELLKWITHNAILMGSVRQKALHLRLKVVLR